MVVSFRQHFEDALAGDKSRLNIKADSPCYLFSNQEILLKGSVFVGKSTATT